MEKRKYLRLILYVLLGSSVLGNLFMFGSWLEARTEVINYENEINNRVAVMERRQLEILEVLASNQKLLCYAVFGTDDAPTKSK